MPKEPLAVAPGQLVMREYEEPPLQPDQVRIKSRLSAEKHGTALSIYRGTSPLNVKALDPELGIYLPEKSGAISFPMKIGNITVGTVAEVGSGVTKLKVGDRAYGYLPVRETHTVREGRVKLAPSDLSDEELVCIDPAVVALMAVREGRVRLGDKVAIFGLGAIGLMAVQMAKLSGALLVAGIEPLENRRRIAEKYGADVLLDPTKCDAGLELRKVTGGRGFDTAIEVSGSYRALHQAIRGTSYGGAIVPVSWYQGEAEGLYLGEEWHFNRQVMISGARVESEPYRDYPLWDKHRVYETVIQLFRQRRLTIEGILSPIVKFMDVIEAYHMIDEKPEKTVKLGVKYC